jgi:hypothetical protein
MLPEQVKHLIESTSLIFIATADTTRQPHMAIGEQVIVSNDTLIFENWFCPETLQNISDNPRVAVVAVLSETGKGYQMIGTIISSADSAFLDGYDPSIYMPETPQFLTRFTVRVDKILEFTSGIHSDLPI